MCIGLGFAARRSRKNWRLSFSGGAPGGALWSGWSWVVAGQPRIWTTVSLAMKPIELSTAMLRVFV